MYEIEILLKNLEYHILYVKDKNLNDLINDIKSLDYLYYIVYKLRNVKSFSNLL